MLTSGYRFRTRSGITCHCTTGSWESRTRERGSRPGGWSTQTRSRGSRWEDGPRPWRRRSLRREEGGLRRRWANQTYYISKNLKVQNPLKLTTTPVSYFVWREKQPVSLWRLFTVSTICRYHNMARIYFITNSSISMKTTSFKTKVLLKDICQKTWIDSLCWACWCLIQVPNVLFRLCFHQWVFPYRQGVDDFIY